MKFQIKNARRYVSEKRRALSPKRGWCYRWSLLVLIGLSLGIGSQAFAAELRIVCHPEISLDSLEQKDVRDIFLGKTLEWDNEVKVVIAIVKTKDVHKDFLKEFVGMTPAKYRMYWKQMIFTGKSSSSPKTLDTEEELLEYVASTEGAIGYVSSDAQTEHVKVLRITE